MKEAGLKPPPATWVDMLAYAKKAQKLPRIFGLGIPVSNQTDSQVWEDIMKSYGARLADDKGKRIILGDHKREVWEFLDYFTEVWKAGVLPPGVATWDNTMNNSTYQSGKAVFILNPITLSLWLEENNPELLAKTGHYTYPKGPKGLIQPVNVRLALDHEVHEGPGPGEAIPLGLDGAGQDGRASTASASGARCSRRTSASTCGRRSRS